MVADSDGHLVNFLPVVPQGVEAVLVLEKTMGGGRSEGDDDLGAHNFDLGENEGAGELDFLGAGGTVVARLAGKGRAHFTDVGEVDLFARKAHRFENLFQLFAGRTGKGCTLLFVVKAGGVADEHQLGTGLAFGKDEGLAEGTELAEGGPVLGEIAQACELLLGGVAMGNGFGDDEWFLALVAVGGTLNHIGARGGGGGGGVG